MALLNPFYRYALFTPFIVITAIPSLVLAVITTGLALLVLFLRTLALGIDLAVTVIPYYLSKTPPESSTKRPPLNSSRFSFSSKTSRKRRTSSLSPKSTTPITFPNLNLGLDASRDYEGVGGWRLSLKLDEQDMLWETINSRLELPGDHGRRPIFP